MQACILLVPDRIGCLNRYYFIFLEFIFKLIHKYLIFILNLIHNDIINEVKLLMMLNSGHCDRPRYHIAYYTFCNVKCRYIVYLILDLVFCFSDMGVAPFCKRTKARSFYKHLQYNKQVFKFLLRKMHAKLSI